MTSLIQCPGFVENGSSGENVTFSTELVFLEFTTPKLQYR